MIDVQAQQSDSSATELFGSNRMWGLKELPLPEPVSWLPQTPGWLVVALVVVALCVWWSVKRYRRWQANAYRREALRELETMQPDPDGVVRVPIILRQAALASGASRRDVTGLEGDAWIDWLNTTAGQVVFDPSLARALDRLPYVPDRTALVDSDDCMALLQGSKTWVRSHRASV